MTATREPRTEPLSTPNGGDNGHGDRLTEETTKLRSRAAIPVDRIFQRVGAVFLCLGILAIIAGWYGVSHTAREWRQTPYLVSGGILGLALVFIGGFSYFAYWLTRLVEQTHRQTAVLERIELALTGGPAGGEAMLVVAAGVLHRAACPLVSNRPDVSTYVEGQKGVRAACPVCEPPLP